MKVNDIITLGTYPQTKYSEEVSPLAWKVLAVEGDKALVITEKIIDQVRFNEKYAEATWETSIARAWMNGEFVEKAFTAEEKAQIVPVVNATPDNAKWGTKGGADTEDMVFALSQEELAQYIPEAAARRAVPTDKAIENGVYIFTETGCGTYWLRSMGYVQYAASRVGCGGTVAEMIYDDVRPHHGVRPAMWIKAN